MLPLKSVCVFIDVRTVYFFQCPNAILWGILISGRTFPVGKFVIGCMNSKFIRLSTDHRRKILDVLFIPLHPQSIYSKMVLVKFNHSLLPVCRLKPNLQMQANPITNLLKDYHKETVKVQKGFIRSIGPYYRTVEQEDLPAFYARLENIWFTRWRLNLINFEDDRDAMIYRQGLIMKVCNLIAESCATLLSTVVQQQVKIMMFWAAWMFPTEPIHRKSGWERYLAFCEARQGISLVRVSVHFTSLSYIRLSSEPRRTRKV